MRNAFTGIVTAVATIGMLGGCTHHRAAQDLALDYNVAFARSRDEMILQNILRASAREPLQFSTMSGLTGTFSTTGGIEIPFTNLIAGGKNAISPTLSLGGSSEPNITITPLASKEFTNGILKPIAPDTINLLRDQGFDLEFLLPLVVGGIICPKTGKLVTNTGDYSRVRLGRTDGRTTYDLFSEMFTRSASGFSLKQVTETEPVPGRFVMASEDALRILKDGLGKDHSIRSIAPAANRSAMVEVQKQSSNWTVAGLETATLCDQDSPDDRRVVTQGAVLQNGDKFIRIMRDAATPAGKAAVAPLMDVTASTKTAEQGAIMLRSVESVIYFLGESHRYRFNRHADAKLARTGLTYVGARNRIRTLFRVDWGLSREPKAVETGFHGYRFFIPRTKLRDAGLESTEAEDRTMKTLSLLNELIALQTSETSIEALRPLIAVGR